MNSFDEDRILAIKSDLKSYALEVTEHISAVYSSQRLKQTSFNLKNDPLNMLSLLRQEFDDILKYADEHRDYAVAHSKDIDECSELSSILEKISSLSDIISEGEKAVNAFSFLSACEILCRLQSLIVSLPKVTTAIGHGTICNVLTNETVLLKSRLNCKLCRCIEACVRIEHGRITVTKVLKGLLRSEDVVLDDCPVLLKDLWVAAVLADQAEEIVSTVLRNFWQLIMRPIWRDRKPVTPRMAIDGDSIAELVIDGSFGSDLIDDASCGTVVSSYAIAGPCKMPLPHLLECVGQLFSFLWAEVFCGNTEIAQIAGRLMSKSGGNFPLVAMLTETMSAQLPKAESELSIYARQLDKPCRDLENKLQLFGFWNSSILPLTSQLMQLPFIYADSRRRAVLRRAREVVLADYHNTMVAAGDALEDEPASAGHIGDSRSLLDQSGSFALQKLRFDSCQVSLSANRTLKLVHETVGQACEAASNVVAHILLQSARDCLEIFAAVVPMKFSEIVGATPRMGAVFYNDCMYIAHNTTLITHKYRTGLAKLDEALASSAGLVDFIPRFRLLGEKCLCGHLDDQRAAMAALVRHIHLSPDGEDDSGAERAESVGLTIGGSALLKGGLKLAGKLRSTSVQTGNRGGDEDCSRVELNDEQAAERVHVHIERLSRQWRGVLQEEVYCRAMGSLLEGVAVQLMTPVLLADCIGADAGTEINRVFKAVQNSRTVFPLELQDIASVQTVCPSWRKFLALADLLEYSLGDIVEWLPRKKFASFSGQEMTSLVKALFEDNEKRRNVLVSILSMSS